MAASRATPLHHEDKLSGSRQCRRACRSWQSLRTWKCAGTQRGAGHKADAGRRTVIHSPPGLAAAQNRGPPARRSGGAPQGGMRETRSDITHGREALTERAKEEIMITNNRGRWATAGRAMLFSLALMTTAGAAQGLTWTSSTGCVVPTVSGLNAFQCILASNSVGDIVLGASSGLYNCRTGSKVSSMTAVVANNQTAAYSLPVACPEYTVGCRCKFTSTAYTPSEAYSRGTLNSSAGILEAR